MKKFWVIGILLLSEIISMAQDTSTLRQYHEIEEGRIQLTISDHFGLLNQLSIQYAYSQPDSSIFFAEKALALAESNGLERESVITLFALGRANYVKGEFSEANKSYSKGLDRAQLLNDPGLISQGYNNVGLILNTQLRFDEAIEIFRKGVAIAQSIKDSTLIIKNSFNASIAFDEMGGYPDSALLYVNKVIILSQSKGDNHMLAMGLNRRGIINHNLSNYTQSIEDHKSALKIIAPENDWERCYAYSGLAGAYTKSGNYEEGIRYALLSLELARSMNAKWEIQWIAGILAEAFAGKGDFKSAYEYHMLHKTYSDSVFTEVKEKEMNALHLERVRLENLALQRENDLREDAITVTRLIAFAIGILFLASVVIVYIYYRKSEQSRKLGLELLEKNKQIGAQRDELESLIKTKDKILSIIAHDMRSPMNALMGLVFQARDLIVGDKELTRLASLAERQILNISGILDNLLRWAQEQYQGEKMVPKPVNLNDIVAEIAELWQSQITEKSIELQVNNDPLAIIRSDVDHAQFIIRNLLGNAVKFTPARGTIDVSFEIQEEHIQMNIVDSGVGMTTEQLNHLFSYQTESTPGTNNEKGSGLGLILCKEYVEMNNGRLEVNSENGKGTTISLIFPRASRMSTW